jgi:hypothetical protein
MDKVRRDKAHGKIENTSLSSRGEELKDGQVVLVTRENKRKYI